MDKVINIEVKSLKVEETPAEVYFRKFVNVKLGRESGKWKHVKIYRIFSSSPNFLEKILTLADSVFYDPVIEEYTLDTFINKTGVEKWYKAGVRDNAAAIAKEAIRLFFPDAPANFEVFTGEIFICEDYSLTTAEKNSIESLWHNTLIETVVKPKPIHTPVATDKLSIFYNTNLSNEDFERISKERLLGLSTTERNEIIKYFRDENINLKRKEKGLANIISDMELECIAQSWSEHCKHKIINGLFHFKRLNGETETIDSIFKTYIKGATKKCNSSYLVSTFSDNSGVIEFDDKTNVCIKVETHNSPSALEPYGGASTGIVGVYRDIMGTGMGAKVIFGTDILCFEKIDTYGIMGGVIKGIRDGGNQSGIPTINGAVLFDKSYGAKPLVFCGAGGIMPKTLHGKSSHIKSPKPGDTIVMIGGRVGRDGIHGATFSSMSLEEGIPSSVVQIADPFTQKKLMDLLIEARDLGILTSTTDNGAGGLSSSVGEMASLAGGAKIELSKVLLKHEGLLPWEILVSESQERMTISTNNLEKLTELSKKYGVEFCTLGEFNDSGYFEVTYDDKTYLYLSLDFLFEGTPRIKMDVTEYKQETSYTPTLDMDNNIPNALLAMLSCKNIRSRHEIFSQYDCEVQGNTIIKPYIGKDFDGPTDAAVIQPSEYSQKCLVVSNGIKPWLAEIDPYKMAAASIDEAIRNNIACGGNLKHAAILDNYCWPDPLKRNEAATQLILASKALYDLSTTFNIPIISGKDSMKNDRYENGEYKAILPTLLISMISVLESKDKILTSNFKNAGDIIYLIGDFTDKIGGSEFERYLNKQNSESPDFDISKSKDIYELISNLNDAKILKSCHDVSDGGLLVAISESILSSNYGAKLDFNITLDDTSHIHTERQNKADRDATKMRSEAYSLYAATTNRGSNKGMRNYVAPYNMIDYLFAEPFSTFVVTVSAQDKDKLSKYALKLGEVTVDKSLKISFNNHRFNIAHEYLSKSFGKGFSL